MEAWKRQCPDEAVAWREGQHAERSESYRREVSNPEPINPTFRQVSILGLNWSLPPDRGPTSRLTERMLHEDWLPLADLLQTREVSGGGVMLDIGANVGTTSVPRVILGDAALVYAAEPEPENFSCLVRNIVDNGVRGVVLPDQVAIDDRNGRVALKLAPTMGAHSVIGGRAGEGSIEVEAVTLDRWVEKLGIDSEAIRFIKVDSRVANHTSCPAARASSPGATWLGSSSSHRPCSANQAGSRLSFWLSSSQRFRGSSTCTPLRIRHACAQSSSSAKRLAM